jgi:hypothetical protein
MALGAFAWQSCVVLVRRSGGLLGYAPTPLCRHRPDRECANGNLSLCTGGSVPGKHGLPDECFSD